MLRKGRLFVEDDPRCCGRVDSSWRMIPGAAEGMPFVDDDPRCSGRIGSSSTTRVTVDILQNIILLTGILLSNTYLNTSFNVSREGGLR